MKHHGGFSAVTKKLKLQPSRASRKVYPTVSVVDKALRSVALEHDITVPSRRFEAEKKIVLLRRSAIDLPFDRNDLRAAMEKFPSKDIALAGNMKMRHSRMTPAEAQMELRKNSRRKSIHFPKLVSRRQQTVEHARESATVLQEAGARGYRGEIMCE